MPERQTPAPANGIGPARLRPVTVIVLALASTAGAVVLVASHSMPAASIAALGAMALSAAILRFAAPAIWNYAHSGASIDSASNQTLTFQGLRVEPLLDGLHDPALLLDRDGAVLFANGPAKLLLHVSFGRHISQTSRSPELLALVDAAISSKAQQVGEARLLSIVEHHLSIIVSPLEASSNAGVTAFLVVLRDLSEHEQLLRLRADFVANASHELRTPLASLRGFLETLRGPARDDPAARDRFLSIMQEQADRMSRVIDDLLSLSRIEMREHVRPADRVDLREIVQHVARTVEPLAANAGVRVRTDVVEGPVVVLGDRDELIQLTQNLAHNAIKYGRKDGEAVLSLGREGDRAVVAVTDDGIGIAPEHLPRLTERFYRVSAKDSRERGGTGLGLAIAKHIINRHQGELAIRSEPGRGSTFTVRLPLHSRSSEKKQ